MSRALPAGMRLSPSPNPCPGCYTLDCYCKYNADHHPWSLLHPGYLDQYMGTTYADCARQARKHGWTLHKDGTATCPRCNKELREGV